MRVYGGLSNDWRACVMRSMAVCGLLLGLTTAPPARAEIKPMFGSYLALNVFGDGEVHPVDTITLRNGVGRATQFRIFQEAPFGFVRLEEIKLALSRRNFTPTGNESVSIELYETFGGAPSGPPVASLTLNAAFYADLPLGPFEYQNVIWQPSFVFLHDSFDYWIAVRITDSTTLFPSELNWHLNDAGVKGTLAEEPFPGVWFSSAGLTQPAIKVRADVNEGCPKSSFLSAGIFGTTTMARPPIELHTELLCPPSALQYYCTAILDVPVGTTSFKACEIMVDAINNPAQCTRPPNTFSAEQSGNIVRVRSTDCPCSGAYVCGDPSGIISVAKTMGYQNDGVGVNLNLFFGGLATGIPADPLIPAGVQIVHEVHVQPNMPPQVFTALFSPGAGATPAAVAQGLEALLQLQGDIFVRAIGDKLRLDAVNPNDPNTAPGYYDVAYRINDTGLLWALVPFDEPDPFELFGTPGRDQQKCINSVNKHAAKIVKAQGKDICSCIKDGAKQKLTGSIEVCIVSDPKGKVAKAKRKYDAKTTKDCRSGSGFLNLADAVDVKQSAMDKDINLIHSIFGNDLDAAILKEATFKTDSKCQQAIAKSAKKCQDQKLKAYNRCKKDELKGKNGPAVKSAQELQDRCLGTGTGAIPDPKGKLAKCNQKMLATITKKCPNLNVFPGCPGVSTALDLKLCIDYMIECEVCRYLNAVDGLSRDCDLFDDGVSNGSCPP